MAQAVLAQVGPGHPRSSRPQLPRRHPDLAMAAKARVLPVLLAAALCAVLFRCLAAPAATDGAFVPSPQLRSTASSLTVQERAAAVFPGAAVAVAPGIAEAATEQELNRFGFIFAIIFLLFFFAAFGRLLTVGKL
uniref:Uncharacterized protein n=1 Tax=Alexandrium monilatum TaxID=311494 RepID=A0A7S4VY74_9DINO